MKTIIASTHKDKKGDRKIRGTVYKTVFSNFLDPRKDKFFNILSIKVESSSQLARVTKKARLSSIEITKQKLLEIEKLQSGSKKLKKRILKPRRSLKEMLCKMNPRPKPLRSMTNLINLPPTPQNEEGDDDMSLLGVKSDSNEKRSRVLERNGKKKIQRKVVRRNLFLGKIKNSPL